MNDIEGMTQGELRQEVETLRRRLAEYDSGTAGEALRQSEERFRNVVESTPMGVFQYDLEDDGRLVFRGSNPAADIILGVDCTQFIGKTIEEAFPPLADTDVPDKYRRAAASGEYSSWEEIDYAHEGIRGAFEVYAFQTKPGSMACMFLDITKRKVAEVALRESEKWFREMANMLPQTVCEIALDGRIAFVNRGALEMFGYGEEDLEAGLNIKQMMTAESFKRASAVIQQVLEGAGSMGNQYTGKRKDGSIFPVLIYSSPVFRDGAPAGLRAIVVDITERARAEEEQKHLDQQMQQAQKLESLGVLVGGIAHDFNNLLLGVMGNAELAMEDLPSTSPVRESVEAVLTSARRAADLCKQMLAYSGKGRYVVQAVDIAAIVEDMSHLLAISISKQVDLRTKFASQLPAIEADVTQLRQVILNLITNASDSIGDERGVIDVRTGVEECDAAYLADSYFEVDLPAGEYVFFEVSDSGYGMDAETQAKVFDPFFSTKAMGRGLGLAAVLGIVRGHGGALKLFSEAGKGTTIKVLFPTTSDAPAVVEQGEKPHDDWSGEGLVLLVDDEETVRTVAQQILERAGFEVVTAKDGIDALEVFEQHKGAVKAVLLDITMPRMGGEDTLLELRRRDEKVPVILSSGYNQQDATNRFVSQGAAGFIQKPYRVRALLDMLREVVG